MFSRARTWIWHRLDRIRYRPMQGDGPHWRAHHAPTQMLTGLIPRPPQRQREITPALIGRRPGTRDAELEAEAG